MKKDKEWLKDEVNELPLKPFGFNVLKQRVEFAVNKDDVLDLIDQLEEPEVLSQNWIDEHVDYADVRGGTQAFIHVGDLQNLTVPKQEEQSVETVADVITDFYKSSERLKQALGTEVGGKDDE